MSEYWKSTVSPHILPTYQAFKPRTNVYSFQQPKYWCKFCKVYVRDTKLERSQHEATGRHQGAIQKSLRDLHKGQEREQREAQRAKDEVARLNGMVGGSAASKSSSASGPALQSSSGSAAPKKQATVEDRKRQ